MRPPRPPRGSAAWSAAWSAEIAEVLRTAGPDDIVWFGRPPLRVDLLRALLALEFDDAWSRRLVIELGGVGVPVVGKEDLIKNQLAAGRPQDRRDARALSSASQPRRRGRARQRH